MSLQELLARIRATPGCKVAPPKDLPLIGASHLVPEDLHQFYSMCGGVSLFEDEPYSIVIVPPSEVVLANPVIVGMLVEDDLSSSWYIIARDNDGDFLTIDLGKERLGRCYNAFHETYGLRGNTPIIATSFTDLLTRLYENRGQHWYWLRPDFVSLGDAYNE